MINKLHVVIDGIEFDTYWPVIDVTSYGDLDADHKPVTRNDCTLTLDVPQNAVNKLLQRFVEIEKENQMEGKA